MYPGISDLFNDLFGTHFKSSFPPSFGTLVAISFLLAAYTVGIELRRKEKQGLLIPVVRKVIVGQRATTSELFWNAIFGFILGFKIVYAIMNSDEFFSNPQAIILSRKGNLLAGLIGAALMAYWKYREKEKLKQAKPVEKEEVVYPHQMVSEITMAAAIGGLLGAKIFHIFEYWDAFMQDPAGMFFSGSGLTMYGGLIVGGIFVLYFGYKNGINPLHMCDANAPGLMLAYGVGRLGCQLAGDGDWGVNNLSPKPSVISFLPDWFWSYTYPHNVINEGIPIPGCTGHYCSQLMYPVFPTPLYESIICISLFFVLWAMRKKIHIPGVLFSWFLLFNGLERFWVESIRVNSKYHVAGIAFSQAQLISSLLIIAGVAGIFYLRSRAKQNAQA
jgi:phosphatidylglycerol:prolipoprotein diacylglycerol transferase